LWKIRNISRGIGYMEAKDYNNIVWSDYFEYSEDSPSGVVWKIPRQYFGYLKYDRIGTPVGSISVSRNTSYYAVGISFGSFQVHRIIWCLLHGSVDKNYDIDHIDGNGLNNKIENLRCVPKSINSRNVPLRIDNQSGHCGVTYQTAENGIGGYRACVVDLNGKKHRKYFSDGKYPNSLESAVSWRISKLEELNNAGYTERHGT